MLKGMWNHVFLRWVILSQGPVERVHGVARSRTRLSDFIFTFHFHSLEKEMATHSSVLAWRIPGTEEPGGLLSLGSHRVGHLGSIPGWGRSPGEGNGNLLQYSCLGNPMDRGSWQAIVHMVANNWSLLFNMVGHSFSSKE